MKIVVELLPKFLDSYEKIRVNLISYFKTKDSNQIFHVLKVLWRRGVIL